MNTQHLPIYKAALDFAVYVDSIVKNQERYHKYGIGQDLREFSKDLLFLINRANRAKEQKRLEVLEKLVDSCEDCKSIVMLAKELKAFKGFKQFEHSSKLLVNICKQAQAWLNASAGILR